MGRTILWWGRFDPNYSRNRIVRQLMRESGAALLEFAPRSSLTAALEAWLHRPGPADLVWVPAFRLRDLPAALAWGRRMGVQVVFDPMISAWDKQVFERRKFAATSWRGERLRRREGRLMSAATLVVADTAGHRQLFVDSLGVDPQRVALLHLGAEEELFRPVPARSDSGPLVLLFFGSYIDLQAPQVIVEAAHRYSGPAVVWQMVGEGPLRKECEKLARGLDNLHFLPQLPYSQLPEQIASSDIVLGVFGAGAKAGRVVPNKVAQGLACARPVITRSSSGYPAGMVAGERGGLFPIAPDDPDALADMVALLANRRQELPIIGAAAAANFRENLGRQVIRGELQSLFDRLAAVADGTQRAP